MVKAVNKLVLEINNTENRYFEKAILYIRPEMSAHTGLSEYAKSYMTGITSGISESCEKKSDRKKGICAVLSALAGAAVTALLFLIF